MTSLCKFCSIACQIITFDYRQYHWRTQLIDKYSNQYPCDIVLLHGIHTLAWDSFISIFSFSGYMTLLCSLFSFSNIPCFESFFALNIIFRHQDGRCNEIPSHGRRYRMVFNILTMTMTMTMKICLLPQIFTVSAKQMQDINTSEKASNSNLPLIISMVKGAWSRSLWAPISVIRKKTFHFEGAENRKKGA